MATRSGERGLIFNRWVEYEEVHVGELNRLEPVFIYTEVGNFGLEGLPGNP